MTSPLLGRSAGRLELTSGPLPRTILRLAIPAVGTTMLTLVLLLIDTFWVGRLLGPAALAAVSTAGFAVWMMNALAQMIEVGLTAVASRRHGEGSHGLAAVAAGSTLMLALLLGCAVAAAGGFFVPLLFAAMNTPPVVTELGHRYLGTYLLGAPAVFGFYAVEASFRAAGDTRTPLVLLAGSVTLSLVLNPLLILGWGPLPTLGMAGPAVAMQATRGTVTVLGLLLLRRRELVRFDVRDWFIALRAMRVGLPVAGTGIFFSLVYVALTRIITPFGVPALAALGIGHKLEGLSYMVATGFGLAAATLVGQNLGAGRVDRAKAAGWITAGYACTTGALVALAFVAIPDLMTGIFTRDAAVVAEGSSYLRALALAQISMGLEIVFESALGGAGYTVRPMFWSGLFTVARIPLSAWLAGPFGVTGVWWVIGLTAVFRGLAMAALWRTGRWQGVRL